MAIQPTDGLNTTENQRKYREQRAIANEQLVVDGTADRIQPGEDAFSLTEQDKRDLGIGEHETYKWIRDDRYWSKHVPGNRFQEWRRENRAPDGSMPGRMVTQDGEPFRNGSDLVLVALPKEINQIALDREAARDKEWFQQIAGAQETERMDDSDFNQNDRNALMRAKQASRRQNSGMIGTGPSAGMAFEDYVRNTGLTAAQMDAEELRYARAGRNERYYQNIEDAPAERTQRDSGSGKFISLPPNVRPRNLMNKK